MKIRPVEKLMLLMLCDLSRKRSHRTINFDLIEKALISDNEWSIGWEGLNSVQDNKNVAFVAQVLSMYQMLYKSFLRLSQVEQQEVIDICEGKLPLFNGFSAEHEYDSFNVAQFFILEMGLFKELSKLPNFDSGVQMMPLYRRMLKTYQMVIQDQSRIKWLSKDGIVLIVVS